MSDKYNQVSLKSSDGLKYLMAFSVVVLIAFLCRPSLQESSYNAGDTWSDEPLILEQDLSIDKSVSPNRVLVFDNTEKNKMQLSINNLYKSISEESIAKEKLNDLKAEIERFYQYGVYSNETRASVGSDTAYLLDGDYVVQQRFDGDMTPISAVRAELQTWVRNNLPGLEIQVNELLDQQLVSNLRTAESIPEALKSQLVEKQIIPSGSSIISTGDVVTVDRLDLIERARQKADNFSLANFTLISFLGYLLLILLIIGALILYLQFNHPTVFQRLNNLSFILMFPAIVALLVYFLEGHGMSIYLIPFCVVPIIIMNFFDERLALFVHIVVVLIASFMSVLDYEFTFIEILAGIVTVLFVSETRYWNQFFKAILIIFATYILGYLGLSLINAEDFSGINWSPFVFFLVSTVMTLLAYPFIPLIEKLFGFTSSITLAELTDMNSPLIKELSINAQGTLQHSLQVSNLAEAATEKIGGNSLLVKAAALYHDIGKLHEPEAFIENNKGHNPHDILTNFESARKIIDHVIKGKEMAKKAKLPKMITDFIMTHHGTTRVEYFYRNQLKEEPDREFDESLFRYPGPKPKSKEQTILMIADSLEAASKSLKSPTGKDIDELVDHIVSYKMKEGQLDESELTFHELEECTVVFKSLLRSINHVRVEYPDEVKPA